MLKKTIPLLFVVFYFYSNGQNGGPTIHVFTPNSPTVVTPAHRDSIRRTDKNCIKWNWSVLTRGEFLMNYELLLTGNLTAEIGAGVTYRDFIFEAFEAKTFIDNDMYGSPSPKYGFEGGLRYFLAGFDNMEDPFLGATISYRTYSYPDANFTPNTGNIVPGYDLLDGQLKFGWVFWHWFNDLVTEFYIGAGYRNATIREYTIDQNLSYNQYNYSYQTVYDPETIKESFPQFLFGFKLGYSF